MPKITRMVVYGDYISENPLRYELRRQDDEVFLTVEEGKGFIAANMNRPFIPRRVANTAMEGSSILLCEQFDDNGKVLLSFLLLPHKLGLWALTPEAAKNGVFHNYKPPRNALDKELMNQGLSRRIKSEVSEICNMADYGPISQIRTAMLKGDFTTLLPDPKTHNRILIEGGTYLIKYYVDTTSTNRYVYRIFYTPDADFDKIAEELRNIKNQA